MSVREAAENVLIAYGMGWDLEGVIEQLQEALEMDQKRTDPDPTP